MKKVELLDGSPALEFEDIRFANTNLLNEAARHYIKYGVYTKAPEGTREFTDFWDREEDRIANGMTIPGRLLYDAKGQVSMQEVHITGDHYAYLNYGRIRLTKDLQEVNSKSEAIIKDFTNTQVARKTVSFPNFWDGDYHYFRTLEFAELAGKNLVVAKARRKGYSYKNAFKCAIKANQRPRTTSVVGAYDTDYLIQGDGTMVMVKNYLDFLEEHTDWARGYINDAALKIRLGYKLQGSTINKGYLSQIIGVSFMNNESAAIGKDAELIIIEEAGKFPTLKEMFDVTQPTLEDGDIIVGIMVVFGTGGTKDANWEAFERMFYEPSLYNALAFHNVWDNGAIGSGCGFFHSHTLNLVPYMDKDGNSDTAKAEQVTLERRAEKKLQAKSATDLNVYIGQRATSPSEAFNRTTDNIFSSKELDDHVEYVSRDETISNLHRHGSIEYADNTVKFVYNEMLPHNKQHPPVFDFPIKTGLDVHGSFVEWFPPYRDPYTGAIPTGLYRVWVDPFAHDKDKEEIKIKDSLMAIYVYERVNNFTPHQGDVLVACYVGRPETIDAANEVALRITRYYNAECQFESDRGDIKGYFKRAGYYHLLADEPEFMFRKQLTGKEKRNKGVKMGADPERKGTAAILLRDFLYKVRKNDEFGNPVYNFQYIFDIGLLKELQKWKLKGNFDRVSALLVGMFDKQEVYNKEIQDASSTPVDDFWNRSHF